jgi:outer membrane lipoprotein-sorting protein
MSKRTFKRSLYLGGVLIIAALTFGLVVSAKGIDDAELVLDGLQKRYESTVDFMADFRQETELKTLNRMIEASGKVYFRRPGKMLWRYQDPKGQLILADGEYLYYYQPEQKQVIKSRLSKAFLSDTPLWARIEDAVGNVTTIHFSSMQRGVGFADSLFRLEVPEGVDVIEFGS